MRKLFALVLCITLLYCQNPAKAHSWYSQSCCSDKDCGPATKVIENEDGSITVTTANGTATFPSGFIKMDSPDGRIHACFSQSRHIPYCLYWGTGT